MTPEQLEAFILFEVEGRTGKEVARIAGQSLPSAFRRLYEAERVVRDTSASSAIDARGVVAHEPGHDSI